MKFISFLLIALVCLIGVQFPDQHSNAGPPVVDDDLTIFDEASQDTQQESALAKIGHSDSNTVERHARDSTTVSTRNEESNSVGHQSPRPPGKRAEDSEDLDLWITGDHTLHTRT